MSLLVTRNLPLLAGAPNGIKKLRGLILELAVRGKLVAQDPNDQPAGELLLRVAAEKNLARKNGSIKQPTLLAELSEDQKPHELPGGWSWVRLSDIAAMRGGCTPSMARSEFWGGDIPWVSPKDMHAGDITGSELSVSEAALNQTSLELVPVGSILIVGRSGILKRKLPVQVTSVSCTINQDLKAITPFKSMPSRYLQRMLQGAERIILAEDVKQGTTVQSLVYDKLFSRPFGLPPVPEQHRIISKVDELMALCDRLEAQQAEGESAHAQLVEALLGSLTQARDADEFAASWQRLSTHFHTLFTTESSIDALKQALLQLAVMGKLVPQDPSDEPALDSLHRIKTQREELKGKKQMAPVDISEDAKPFDLPVQWTWTTLTAIGELARGKSRHRPRNDPALYTGGNIPLIQTGDVARADGVVMSYTALYNAVGLAQSRLWMAGTMCITIAANIADTAILGFDACFPDSVVGFIPALPELDVRYFDFYMRTAKSRLEDFAPSTAQKNINLEILGILAVPMPPCDEIRRIVAKVDQLMALCDQLKSRLTQARQLNEQLATTLVERAVA